MSVAIHSIKTQSGRTIKFGSSHVVINTEPASEPVIEPPDGLSVTIGGRTYPAVEIFGQVWMAENLDLKFDGLTVGSSSTSVTDPLGNYYNNDEATYGVAGNKYGMLYNWAAANYIHEHRAELCPGWHVPSNDEWNTLAVNVGGAWNSAGTAGTKLKSTTDWKTSSTHSSTDEYGFTAYPTGYRTKTGTYVSLTQDTRFWTSTSTNSTQACEKSFSYNYDMMGYASDRNKLFGQCIRLIKDT